MPGRQIELIRKISLLKHKSVYAVEKYASYISVCFKNKSKIEKPPKESVLFVYRFKKYFTEADTWELIIRTVCRHFDCMDIVAVPGHLPQKNSIQRLFGTKIERIRAVEPRKYTRATGWPDDYTATYRVHEDRISGSRILLIDDILITGETMKHFAGILAAKFQVIPLALGIDYKLATEPADDLYLYRQADPLAAEIDNLRI